METAAERDWAGQFGTDYHNRQHINQEATKIFFERALLEMADISTVLELGAGTGANLEALRTVCQSAHLTGLEINEHAAAQLEKVADRTLRGSLLELNEQEVGYDLVLTKGVLIHIPPDYLARAYEIIHRAATGYILIAEYYNPTPVEVNYRGKAGRLWKRDFAGEMLDKYKDLSLVDYGFVYHRDQYPQDDVTWFLLEKQE